MARGQVIEGVILQEAWRIFVNRRSFSSFLSQRKFQTYNSSARNFCSGRKIDNPNNCSNDENLSSSTSVVTKNIHESPQKSNLQTISDVRGLTGYLRDPFHNQLKMLSREFGTYNLYEIEKCFSKRHLKHLLTSKSTSDTSKTECKVGQTTNMVFGSTVIDGSTGEWLTLNQKLNTYPTVRRFTAIGIGGDDFVQSMVLAVQSVIQHPIPLDYVKRRVSSGGKYISVNIGPVRVVSSEQVRDVYNAMRSDDRMKFFL